MESNSLLHPFQSAYRPNHSVESTLVRVKNYIMFALNSDRVILMVLLLLDLSAAFDTIYHDIFVARLCSRIGVRSVALSWFKPYLSGWSSQVEVNYPVPKFQMLGYLKGQLLAPQVIHYIHFRKVILLDIILLVIICMQMIHSYMYLSTLKPQETLKMPLINSRDVFLTLDSG